MGKNNKNVKDTKTGPAFFDDKLGENASHMNMRTGKCGTDKNTNKK